MSSKTMPDKANTNEAVHYRLKPNVRRTLIGFGVFLVVFLLLTFLLGSGDIGNILNNDRQNQEIKNDDNAENGKEPNEGSDVSSINTKRDKFEANTKVSMSKARYTSELIENTCVWRATDYVAGDLKTGKYQVQRGDTLWELADGSYGEPYKWKKIMKRNAKKVGYLPSGQKALIFPKQVLVIPE